MEKKAFDGEQEPEMVKPTEVRPNRRDRRAKGRGITIADIRGFRARMIMSGLYRKPEENE